MGGAGRWGGRRGQPRRGCIIFMGDALVMETTFKDVERNKQILLDCGQRQHEDMKTPSAGSSHERGFLQPGGGHEDNGHPRSACSGPYPRSVLHIRDGFYIQSSSVPSGQELP